MKNIENKRTLLLTCLKDGLSGLTLKEFEDAGMFSGINVDETIEYYLENKEVIDILLCGAKNNAMAKALKEAGYCYFVYGFDVVERGLYQEYNGIGYDEPIMQCRLSHEDDNRGDFVYIQDVREWDIPVLKELYLS